MLITKEAVALKLESSYMTEAVPDPLTDSILISDISQSNEALRMLQRNNVKPTISTDKSVFAGTLKKIGFTAELKGSGTQGVAPEIGQALRACGLGETIVAGTSVTYAPVSDNHESATIYYYEDSRLRKLLGARGNATIDASAGDYGKVQFEFTGHDGGLVDSSFPTLAYDNTVPAPFINIAFTVDGYGPVINTFNLGLGNTVITPGNVRNQYGFGEIRISKRDPNGTIDPEAVTLATKDFEAAFKAGTEMALSTGAVGTTPGNRWQVDANIALRDIGHDSRDEVRVDSLTFGCHEQTTDDEFSIIFT